VKIERMFGLCLALSLLVNVAYGQRADERRDEALKIRTLQILNFLEQSTDYGPTTQEQIAEAKAGQLVSILEEKFVHSQDADIKARVAKALLDLGDKNEAYWDFLMEQAKLAIESDVPSSRCLTPTSCTGHSAYVAWARAHNAPEDSEAEMKLHWLLEERVGLVYGDPRGIPLLREALKSANINIVSTGADALTRAHDKDSIPLIVEACKRFHDADEVTLIAHTLRQFIGDPEAQAAARAGEEQCLPPPPPIAPAENVAILKRNFLNTQDDRDKAQTASALIGLGEKEYVYWDFLLRMATSLLESEASFAVKNDSQGKPIEGGPSSDEAWAKQDRHFNEMLTFVETVAETRDPRGIRLLRRALSSANFQGIAAAGLVRAGDKDSIPLIIDLCRNGSPDVARYFASEVLVYFDDPRAQSAVDQYLSKEDAKAAREQKAQGIGPLGPWPPK
jgi:HEAT repeat protein